MEVIAAVAHIVGALIVLFALTIAWLVVGRLLDKREQASIEQAMALDLGLDFSAPCTEEIEAQIKRWVADRFSSELFRNRLSDVCAVVRTAWAWVTAISIIAVLGSVGWYALSDGPDAAAYAWLIIPMWVISSVLSLAFSLCCKVLTGRYPGQARAARKELAKLLAQQSRGV